MRMHHTPSHWILVALVLLALLLTLSEAHGQPAGAAAAFEGRPAMAGAQAGLGAQAGPPQGGLGVQGSQAAERGVHLRRPANQTGAAPGPVASTKLATAAPRDRGVARDEHSAARKAKRAAKRSMRRARTGTSEIDSSSS